MGFSARLFIMPEAGRGTVLLTNQRPFDDELAGGATTRPDVRYADTTFHLLRGPWSFAFADERTAGATVRMRIDERAGEAATDVAAASLARKVADEAPDPTVVAGHPGTGRGPPGRWLGLAVALVLVVAIRPLWARTRRARRPRSS